MLNHRTNAWRPAGWSRSQVRIKFCAEISVLINFYSIFIFISKRFWKVRKDCRSQPQLHVRSRFHLRHSSKQAQQWMLCKFTRIFLKGFFSTLNNSRTTKAQPFTAIPAVTAGGFSMECKISKSTVKNQSHRSLLAYQKTPSSGSSKLLATVECSFKCGKWKTSWDFLPHYLVAKKIFVPIFISKILKV